MKRKVFEDWNLSLDVASTGDPSNDVVSFHSRSLGRDVAIEPTLAHQPDGIRAGAVAAGIKYPDVLDFTVVKLDRVGSAAGVFTNNLCPGYAIPYDRHVLSDGKAQALVVVSKNANVFTPNGAEDTVAIAASLAAELGVDAQRRRRLVHRRHRRRAADAEDPRRDRRRLAPSSARTRSTTSRAPS